MMRWSALRSAAGADLRWVMLGSNKITYENYWYDDVSVVDDGDYGDYWHGDYNGDGVTDAADYVMWRKGNLNGLNGYNTWRRNFDAVGSGSGSRALLAVPEPATIATFDVGPGSLISSSRSLRRKTLFASFR